jgi:hypothetical protein
VTFSIFVSQHIFRNTTVKATYTVLKLLYAVPNGGDRNLRVARKLKAEGVLAGVADLCLPAARRGYHGLYIEMKSEEGTATEEQKRVSSRRVRGGILRRHCSGS